MKTLQFLLIVILTAGSIILLYSITIFELAKQHFEAQRSGLECANPASNCPFPDFQTPVFYGINGGILFGIGAITMIVIKRRRK